MGFEDWEKPKDPADLLPFRRDIKLKPGEVMPATHSENRINSYGAAVVPRISKQPIIKDRLT